MEVTCAKRTDQHAAVWVVTRLGLDHGKKGDHWGQQKILNTN